MTQRKMAIKGNPEDFRRMDRIMTAARKLVADHLDRPYREMLKTGCSDVEVACAFISLAYFILRRRRSADHAAGTFDALAHLDRQRHEAHRSRMRSKLH